MKYHTIDKNSIENVLERAKQYRSLLQPEMAISICLDIFAVDKNNQDTLVIYILALTDQLGQSESKIHHKKITDSYMNSVIIFVFAYLFIFILIAMLLSITGLNFLSAISGAATSISNVGPGLGEMIGPNGNFKSIPEVSKWILSFGMLLGRLELFAVLILFFPSFWRN